MSKSLKLTLAAWAASAAVCLVPAFHLQVLVLIICMAVSCMALACAFANPVIRYSGITLFSLLLGLLILEANYFWIIKRDSGLVVQRGGIFEQGLAQPTEDVGYGPVPGSTVRSRAVRDGQQLYDVTYHIDAKGRRVTPDAPHAHTAVLLFGCSFTFAEGLEDEQAMAWKLGQELGPGYKVFNFGFSGYGPHHMQAIIEKGIPELAQYQKVVAYHVAIEGHQRRVAGVSPWDKNGPRYELKDGKAVRNGSFAQNPPFFWEGKWEKYLDRSFFFKGIKQQLSEMLAPYNTLEKRLALTKALITSSAKALAAQHAATSFTVLAWPPNAVQILTPLDKSVPMLDVEKWLPGYAKDRAPYIIPLDRHPSALANDLAAQELAKHVRSQAAALGT